MVRATDPRIAYETVKLQWMIDHGFTIPDLIINLESMIVEDQNESGVQTGLQSLFQDWEYGIGFTGAIWPSYHEFLEKEYLMMLKSNHH